MPIPKSRDPGRIVSFLARDKPEMKKEQRVAIALSEARKAGANIKEKKKKQLNAMKKMIKE